MTAQRILVLGTQNRKKGEELAELFGPYGFQLLTLSELRDVAEVVEDGDTFAANARGKATKQARHLEAWVLGEDSGIVVDALTGAPGVYSARFSGENATDESNNRLLLQKLNSVPIQRRTARYVCHMALSDPAGQIRADCEATCEGRIHTEPRGTGGFGYDPLFEIVEYHKTFGQLGNSVKSVLSHRARAAKLLLPQLLPLVRSGSGEWPRPRQD